MGEERWLEPARKDAADAFPDASSEAAEGVSDFGSRGRMGFPAPGSAYWTRVQVRSSAGLRQRIRSAAGGRSW